MALVALAIKLDSRGPVLFKQKRYGFNNDLIEVYKFRSMYADKADADRRQARHQGRSARHPRRPLHPQDQPRRAAAALQRRVQGQPVAGRPAPARGQCQGRERGVYDEAVDGYFARHRVKPGITGWAQINGWRGETDTQEKIQQPRRARPLLHRELVGAARSLHPGAHAVRAAQHRERLLITARDMALRSRRGLAADGAGYAAAAAGTAAGTRCCAVHAVHHGAD